MTNALEMFEKKQIEKLTAKKRVPAFRPGDTLKVTVKIIEGEKSRSQAFEGMCIARKNNSISSNFTVRKISFGEGVERTFALFSPIINSIKVIRTGKVRRAKLYYLRDRTGKSARIAEKIKKKIGIDVEVKSENKQEEEIESQIDSTLKSSEQNIGEVKKETVQKVEKKEDQKLTKKKEKSSKEKK